MSSGTAGRQYQSIKNSPCLIPAKGQLVSATRQTLPSVDINVWMSGKKAEATQLSGALHAKCAVADGELAFITSANLTAAAIYGTEHGTWRSRQGWGPFFELHHHLEAPISTKLIEKVKEGNEQ